MKPILILSLAFVVVLAGCRQGQSVATNKEAATTPLSAPISSSANIVKVRTEPVIITTGSDASATVTLSILPGYHINANPATFSYLISTEVTAQNSEEITADKPVYPAAQTKKFQFAEKPL